MTQVDPLPADPLPVDFLRADPVDVDPLYVAARRVLLDAVDALSNHRESLVLVGAQAIYLQAGEADLTVGVAPFTTDADLGIDPQGLGSDPRIVEAMTGAGFTLKVKSGDGGIEPGTWLARTTVDERTIVVPVDLLVPEALAPHHSRRDARLPDHGRHATRWTPGLEASVVDHVRLTIASLEPDVDDRRSDLRVAGPAALLIAKSHKLAERITDEGRGRTHRVRPKDAGDVIRLMRSPVPPDRVGARLADLACDPVCGPSVRTGVEHLRMLFGSRRSRGVDLAVQALGAALPEHIVRELAPGYVAEMLAHYRP